ncbi:D-inositol-3-phosphate glycosyltransferase [Leucobacter komagatae]|uniref:D-inositol-3-phosphate glycosyltransferase n=1 Tax=Leucobacter komagatae TaxID=55969 RepID=A0A542Y7U6_9MICO|nr:glycosyltransferase [Leucobacter komagatae]TQL44178.1 D-inositol-3-phosphate glycosyltransferase [Leucobacter komagatae]
MRIALVSLHTSPSAIPGSGDAGGMNVVVAEAAHALSDRGHEVIVATRANTEVAAGEQSLRRPQVSGEGRQGDPAGSSPRLIALAAGDPALAKGDLPAIVPEFARGLRELGPFDAVHAHYWLSGLAAVGAFGGEGSGIATTFHTLAAQKNSRLAPGDRPEPEVRVLAEQSLAETTFVVAGSRSELAGVEEFCGHPRVGSAVVHPGVDTRLFVPRPAPRQFLRVTVLGRVQPLKGQDLAVRAAVELAAQDPDLFARTEWVIAGEPTPGAEGFAAGLRELAEAAGVSDRVRFLPAQSRAQAAALLASSDLVLVPSHSETFGLTALEAGASGIPVIAAGHTGLVEAVPEGVAGLHMPDRDPAAWARAIAELLRDEPRRLRLGESARRHAEQHDWAAHAAALERIYEGLIR